MEIGRIFKGYSLVTERGWREDLSNLVHRNSYEFIENLMDIEADCDSILFYMKDCEHDKFYQLVRTPVSCTERYGKFVVKFVNPLGSKSYLEVYTE